MAVGPNASTDLTKVGLIPHPLSALTNAEIWVEIGLTIGAIINDHLRRVPVHHYSDPAALTTRDIEGGRRS